MRIQLLCLAVIGTGAALLLSGGQSATAGILGTDHDFKGDGYGTDEVCQPCHTPHNADTTITYSPLWNHDVTTETFALYSSATLDATMAQPDGVSKLCLSCHDGSIAIDSFGGQAGADFITGPGGAFIGTDLGGHHPVGFTYDDALATTDGGLFAPTTALSGLGGTIDNDLLISSKLECSSCHDVHDDTEGSFLVMTNTASNLCLTCHDK